MREYVIEMVELEDIPVLCAFAFKTYKNEIGKGLPSPKYEDVVSNVTRACLEGFSICVRDKTNNNNIIGCLLCDFDHLWWNQDYKFLSSMLFYVEPGVRSLKISKSMVDYVKNFCDTNNLTFNLSFVGEHKFTKRAKFLTKLGFTPISIGGVS